MFLSFLLKTSDSVPTYVSIGNELIISGDGEVNQAGVRSKGDFNTVEYVEINEGITSIANHAFSHCFNLFSVTIPASVTSIGYPFFRNERLTVIKVHKDSLSYCTDVQGVLYDINKNVVIKVPTKPVTIPEGVTTIRKYAFNCFRAFKWDIVFPSSLTTIEYEGLNEALFGSLSFKENSKLTELDGFGWGNFDLIRIPASCKLIKPHAFNGAVINQLTFDSGSTFQKVQMYAFEQSTIERVSFPDSLQTIETNAFYLCRSLTTVSVGKSCSKIDKDAFVGCEKFTTLIIPETNNFFKKTGDLIMNTGSTQIIDIAKDCSTINIPDSVQYIGCNLLQHKNKLKEVTFTNNPYFKSKDGVVYSNDYSLLQFVCGGVESVTAHKDVKSISFSAAAFCKNLKTFAFDGIVCTSIGPLAFFNSSLLSFTLPDSVTTLKSYSFMDCFYLTSFTIKETSKLEQIQDYVFKNAHFDTIFIPQNVTLIGIDSFQYATLTTVEFSPNAILETIKSYAFRFSTIKSITFADSIKTISENCFRSCVNLESISFNANSNLETIKDSAFCNCTSLLSVNLPAKCTTLGGQVFTLCTNLSQCTYGSLSSIGFLCFSQCTKLQTFLIKPSLKEIKANTFTGCISLNSFTIGSHEVFTITDGTVYDNNGNRLYLYPPGRKEANIAKNVNSFRENAFSGCTILRDLIFESGNVMKEFEKGSFLGCVSLKNIRFPAMLERIGDNCFAGCTSLETILLPTEMNFIGENAFSSCTSLQTVKYCGTNERIEGTNVFPPTLGAILVTNFYKAETLCSHRVAQKLKANCEISIKMSCLRQNYSLPSLFTICLFLIF